MVLPTQHFSPTPNAPPSPVSSATNPDSAPDLWKVFEGCYINQVREIIWDEIEEGKRFFPTSDEEFNLEVRNELLRVWWALSNETKWVFCLMARLEDLKRDQDEQEKAFLMWWALSPEPYETKWALCLMDKLEDLKRGLGEEGEGEG